MLTIQKEVAERICAQPKKMNPVRDKKSPISAYSQSSRISNGMNLLAAIIQFWAEPKIIARLKNTDFSPPPKIDSAVLQLTTYDSRLTTRSSQPITQYSRFVRILFKQPRKTILNNLSRGLHKKKNDIMKALKAQELSGIERGETLDINIIQNLFKIFHDRL